MSDSVESFRERLARHQAAGTCYLCGEAVVDGQARHGATDAHWDCTRNENKKLEAAWAKVGGIAPKPARKQEGEGRTALRAKALALAALQEAVGAPLEDITVWNQKGVYRGPRWDLDAWGLHFWFYKDGHRFSGSASSLATMGDCVRYKRLEAKPEGVAFSHTLWEHPAKQVSEDSAAT
jgi:hypothetical protein